MLYLVPLYEGFQQHPLFSSFKKIKTKWIIRPAFIAGHTPIIICQKQKNLVITDEIFIFKTEMLSD
ncbi:hypothetical protein FBFR_15495 [Flavobacterium fryxellicola]|uniref:Uncharacterized protein n=1 Tax=Flavobacterium fryxellicola TaxID=249352 RepID=A0A167TYQ5_9FLAO|nr:hypothetical protein FBFR_15495 [Flavobacterium fryxellicola]